MNSTAAQSAGCRRVKSASDTLIISVRVTEIKRQQPVLTLMYASTCTVLLWSSKFLTAPHFSAAAKLLLALYFGHEAVNRWS
jgi:hypothetical protein